MQQGGIGLPITKLLSALQFTFFAVGPIMITWATTVDCKTDSNCLTRKKNVTIAGFTFLLFSIMSWIGVNCTTSLFKFISQFSLSVIGAVMLTWVGTSCSNESSDTTKCQTYQTSQGKAVLGVGIVFLILGLVAYLFLY